MIAESEEDAIHLSEQGRDTSYADTEAAFNYLRGALDWFEDNTVSIERARAYNRLARTFVNVAEYDSAAHYYQLSSSTAFNIQDYKSAISMQDNFIMSCLLPRGKFKPALDIALKVKEMTRDSEDPEIKFLANRLLIDVYWDLDEFKEEFLKITIETEELAYETDDSSNIETALFFLASAYGRNDKRELSIEVYRRVAKILLKRKDYHVSATFNNMATQFRYLGQMDSAIANYQRGLEYSILEGRPDGIAASKLRLGQTYGGLGEFDKSLALCLEAFQILQDDGIVRRQEQCTECIYLSYQNLGHKEKAFDYVLLDIALRDSLLSRGEQQELKLIQSEFHGELDAMKDSLDFAYTHSLNEAKIEQQKNRSYFLYAGLGVTIIFAFFILNRFRITRKQKGIIEEQKSEVELAHEELTEKNQEILDSITYAKRIQSAILPQASIFNEHLPNSFVLYEPKDIVAGDFYWMEKRGDELLFAAADCTGHGVPGAMVSVVCNNGLNRSVREHGLTDPGKILDKTREIIIGEFEKSEEEVKDGMDIALCSLFGSTLKYAGANNPIWIIRKDATEIEETKADKQPIGKYLNPVPYTTQTILLNPGDTFYIFTDGYVDQFGGEKGEKFKASNLKELLLSIQDQGMESQKSLLKDSLIAWKGSLEQVDDVCMIGVRV